MNTLTLLCGFPACGKSTVASEMIGVVVLCPDDFRKVLTGQDFYAPAEELVWGTVKTCARVLLRSGHTVVIDATNLTIGSRAQWIKIAGECGVPINCHWVSTGMLECKRRNAMRTRTVPDTVMDRMAETFEPPTVDEGFDHVTIESAQWATERARAAAVAVSGRRG